MRYELIENLNSQQLLQMKQKSEPLFIWYGREGIVRIFLIEINYQFSELVMLSEKGDSV